MSSCMFANRPLCLALQSRLRTGRRGDILLINGPLGQDLSLGRTHRSATSNTSLPPSAT